MQYVHDVWVNWFEGEENGYNVCAFHEWRNHDGIEILDQVPVLRINTELFDQIENDLIDLPKKMLELVKNCTYLRKNQERITVEYASIVTDGNNIIVFDTLGYQIPIRKSRMIPRQERLVLDLINDQKESQFTLETESEKAYHILSLPPKVMIGLTRRERHLKQLLMMVLDQLKQIKNPQEAQYWLTEWKPDDYQAIQKMTFAQAWNELYLSLVNGWSTEHELFCRKMIKGQPFFEQLWQLEKNNAEKPTYKRIL
ncbi:hypothetical protein Pryu01_01682 [Paraliobacillus ryukyuensis]|uniref:Uncharacterized protein DUF3603 n=1 Tax=Paraliobacillus ryukyuensis TaxID=200904 RepID=A0A366E9W1_9BACI|nr:DUF3603 family protein [Paraliobacillus ryukyuensis]RBO98198.1 uncharacterized protein DUF3603 [Paraliobacillus ryukyuensis]